MVQRIALLALFIFPPSFVYGADDFPDDTALTAMAYQHALVRDLNFSSANSLSYDPNVTATILKKGAVRPDGALPVRFKVVYPMDKVVLVMDARFFPSDFGDITMTWHLNFEQTTIERKAAMLKKEGDRQREMENKKISAPTNELAIVTTLRSGIGPAQLQFAQARFLDVDQNDKGEYAPDLAVLSGLRPLVHNGEVTALTLLPPALIPEWIAEKIEHTIVVDMDRNFWCFIYLPLSQKTLIVAADKVVKYVPGRVLPASVERAQAVFANATNW